MGNPNKIQTIRVEPWRPHTSENGSVNDNEDTKGTRVPGAPGNKPEKGKTYGTGP